MAVVAAYERGSELERARAAAAALIATDSHEEAAQSLARAAAREGDVADAWRLVQSITDRFRREGASSDVAEELAALGRFSEAATFARAQLQPAQDLARVALSAAKAGDRVQATALAKTAHAYARTASDHPLRYRWLTALATVIGDADGAVRITEAAEELLPEVNASDLMPGRRMELLALAAETLELHDLVGRLVASAESTEYPSACAGMLTRLAATTTPARARALLDQALEIAWPPEPAQSWRIGVLAEVSAGLAALDDDRAFDLAQIAQEWCAGNEPFRVTVRCVG